MVRFHWWVSAGCTFGSQTRMSAPANGSLAEPTGAKPWPVVVVGNAEPCVLHQRFSFLEGRVHRQAQVRTGAFQVGRNSESAAHHGFSTQTSPASRRNLFEAAGLWGRKLRYKVPGCSFCMWSGQFPDPRCAIGSQHFSGRQIEVDLLVIFLHPGRERFVTQAQVEGQVVRDSPVILGVARDRAGSVRPDAASKTRAVSAGQSEVKIRAAVGRCRDLDLPDFRGKRAAEQNPPSEPLLPL